MLAGNRGKKLHNLRMRKEALDMGSLMSELKITEIGMLLA